MLAEPVAQKVALGNARVAQSLAEKQLLIDGPVPEEGHEHIGQDAFGGQHGGVYLRAEYKRRIVIDRLWDFSFKTRACRLPFIEVHPLYRQHQTIIIDGRFESNPAQMTVTLPHPTASIAIGESHLAAEGLMHRAIEIPDGPHGFARSNGRE